jgi:hypothetical protein
MTEAESLVLEHLRHIRGAVDGLASSGLSNVSN